MQITSEIHNKVESTPPAKQAEASRELLLKEVQDSFKSACIAKDAAKALSSVERVMGSLAKLDGGAQTSQFQKDIAILNEQMEPVASLKRVLPLMQIVGLDSKNHVQVLDQADGKTENLIVGKDGLLGPDAPVDASVKHQLYLTPDGKQDWKQAIAPQYVEQARLGDCYFLSGVQALAAKDPEAIKKMIHDNGAQADGRHTYTVTFPGANDKLVTVSEPTIYEATAFAQDSGGLWTNVLEKAHRKITGRSLSDPGDSVISANGLSLLSKFPATPVDVEHAQIHQLLSDTNDKSLIGIGTTKPFNSVQVTDVRGNQMELLGGHMYSILSYDEKNETVTLGNPWGVNPADSLVKPDSTNAPVPAKFDAIFAADQAEPKNSVNTGARLTISIADFKKNFGNFAISPISGG